MMGSSLCWADSSGVADDPSLRTWTNKNTGSTVEARPVALNMKTSMPSGPVAEEMKGKTYMLENGKLKKRDGKLNPKHFILYFSASWCGPCCRNAPHSVEAYNRVVKDNPDVEVIMCNLDQNLDAAQKWAAANNMPWPILLKEDLTELAKKVAPRGIPTMILVDKDGKPIQSSQNMEQLVKAIGSSRSSR